MAKSKYNIPDAKELLDAGVHFGHQVRRWHPGMEPYIFTVKKNIHIIDLEQTERLLKEACEFLYNVASRGGKVIFVGTKRQAREMVEIEAKRSGALYVNERWLGGTVTNHNVIKKKTKKLTDLRRGREEGEFKKYTKKERLLIDREIEKLERYVGGIVGLNTIPEALFILDARREKTAIREAASAKIKVVGLVDTNTNPKGIDYIIPGNDDGIKSIALIIKVIADAVEAGYKDYADKLTKGEVPETSEKMEKEPKKEPKEKVTTKVASSESPVSTKDAGKKAAAEAVMDVEEDLAEAIDDEKIVEEFGIEVKDDEETPGKEKAKEIKVKKTKANTTKKEK